MPSKMNFKDLLQDGVLDLSMADLDEVPVKDVIQLKKVMHLDLSNNRLQTLGKNFISLNFLVHLDLSNNQLTELPDDIGEFKQLKHLDLCNNQLVHLPLSLGQCKFLSWLDLKDNPLLPALSEVVGPCLDAKQCQESAKNIVNFMQMMQMQLDNRRLAEKQKHEVEKAVVEEITETQTQVKKESKKKKKAQKIAEKKEATQVQTNKKENGVKREQPKEENVKKKVQIGKEHIQEIGSEETPRKCNAVRTLKMKGQYLLIYFILVSFAFFASANHNNGITPNKYSPTWDSLDTRPLPQWFDKAKIGIFLHWGVFSVPSFKSEWFWNYWQMQNISSVVKFMADNYRPGFTYQDFASEFTAEFYDPDEWAQIFKDSGARYIVLTSKHHEGYTLWPSKYSYSWNAMDVGPRRDLIGDLANAIRGLTDLKFGLYHSFFEWFNPLYNEDKKNNFTTKEFVNKKSIPELYELVNTYKPEVVWSDGDGEASDDYWESKEFLAWLYNESPVKETVVVNDRWGAGISCHHGDFYSCQDRYNPGTLQPHKWENAMTIDKQSWGYRRNAKLSDYFTIEELLQELASTVSCGGNLLMNIGPTKEGIIPVIFAERLRNVGSWLKINGEGIYNSVPWTHQNDTLTPGVWYTKGESNAVYAIILSWPANEKLALGSPQLTTTSQIEMLGQKDPLQWVQKDTLEITFPSMSTVLSKWAWVLKMTDVQN